MQNQQNKPFQQCEHTKTVTKSGIQNCYSCGIYIPNDNIKAYKTGKLSFGTTFNPQSCLKSIKKIRQPMVAIDPASEYAKQRNALIEYMCHICEKLRVSINTTHISIYFMDFLNSKMLVPESQMKIYAATACMLGAKAIELDERIPFISKLQRYSDLKRETAKEIMVAENNFVKLLKWNLQCVTLVDVLEFYLSQGVIMSTDKLTSQVSQDFKPSSTVDNALQEKSLNSLSKQNSVNQDNCQELKSPITNNSDNHSSTQESDASDNQKQQNLLISELSDSQINSLAQKIEKEYTRLSNLVIRDTSFYKYEVNVLSTASIAFLRQVIGIENKWNESLEKISHIQEEQLEECFQKIESSFKDYFVTSYTSLKPKGIQLKSKTINDIQEIENNLYASKYSNQNKISQYNNLSDNKKNQQSSYLKDPAYNFDSRNSISKYSENSNRNNSILTFQHSNSYQYQPKSGISTLNSGSNNYVRHQSTIMNNQQSFQPSQQYNNQRFSSYNVQKVFRMNSTNV